MRTGAHPWIHATRGSVLVVVLWVSFGLVSISLLFGHSMLLAYRSADNDLSGREAEQAIEGAIRYAKYLLSETTGEMPATTDYQSEAVPVGEAEFWFIGRGEEQETSTNVRVYGLVDENSRICLNAGSTATDVAELATILSMLPGMTTDLAALVQNWRTTDKAAIVAAQTSSGTGTDIAAFESLDELAMIEGFDPTVIYGEDTNGNGVLDANEDDGEKSAPADNSDGKLTLGLGEYVTVFTHPPTGQRTSQGGITLPIDITQNNTNWRNDLRSYLGEKFTAAKADAVFNVIQPNVQGFNTLLEFYRAINGGQAQAALTDDEFDHLTADLKPSSTELLNVNTVGVTVLSCIPGIAAASGAPNPVIAQQVIDARTARTQPSTGLAWAFKAIDDAGGTSATAGKWLTGLSLQVSADVAAVGRFGRGYRRERVVIDRSGTTPRVMYRRNLAPFGWALGSDVRQTFAIKDNR